MSFDVPFIRPSFPEPRLIAEDAQRIIESGWFSNFGPAERELSSRLAEYTGQGVSAITVANATLGILAAADAVFGEGDRSRRVLVPSFSFAASAQVAEWCGFAPLFVDIDPQTLQPSLEHARLLASEGHDIAGIIHGNAFGIGAADIDDWVAQSEEWGVGIIIDSAAGFGSVYPDGSRLGARGACEVFSFHATKPFAVGEGGAVTSRDPEVIARIREFENFGFAGSRMSAGRGMNAKMSEFAAAMGLRQLERFDEELASRREVVEVYRDALDGSTARLVPGLELSSVCFATMVIPHEDQLAATRQALAGAGVEFRDYYNPPVHLHPRFERWTTGALPETERAARMVISLPVHADMAARHVAAVAEALRAGATA